MTNVFLEKYFMETTSEEDFKELKAQADEFMEILNVLEKPEDLLNKYRVNLLIKLQDVKAELTHMLDISQNLKDYRKREFQAALQNINDSILQLSDLADRRAMNNV